MVLKLILPKRDDCGGAVNKNKSCPSISLYMNSTRWISPEEIFKILGPPTNRSKHFSSGLYYTQKYIIICLLII